MNQKKSEKDEAEELLKKNSAESSGNSDKQSDADKAAGSAGNTETKAEEAAANGAGKVNAADAADTASETSETARKPTREEELQAQVDEYKDKYLRLAADFDNFRKRSAKESGERAARATENFAIEVLDVVDNIDRALAADEKALREGVVQIQKVLAKILENHSISPIESKNAQFDPNKHEAIAYVPSDEKEGIIIDELIRGYTIGDKVLRCAKVAVSKGKEE
ncbi:MAG: nucleotide exchange factor GrpE [Methanomicrobium sp.]|nr:nucleotide exchange factor GrpE [Methanomicrobium sp.]